MTAPPAAEESPEDCSRSACTGGAVHIGVDGVCIISHGSSSARAIANAVGVAADCVATDVVAHMKKAVTHAG